LNKLHSGSRQIIKMEELFQQHSAIFGSLNYEKLNQHMEDLLKEHNY